VLLPRRDSRLSSLPGVASGERHGPCEQAEAVSLGGSMERRCEHRFGHRMACQLHLHDRLHQGFVLDVSPSGLFVRTRAKTPRLEMAPVTVEVRSAASDEALTLSAVIARQYRMPDPLHGCVNGGMGLRVIGECAAWLELLDEIAGRKKRVLLGREALPPLRQVPPPRCGECGRERTTLWSELCGWCSGKRPRRRSHGDASGS
jgi:hypothetical protein